MNPKHLPSPAKKPLIVDLGPKDISSLVRLEKAIFASPWEEGPYLDGLSRGRIFALGVKFEFEVVAYITVMYLFDEAEIINIAVSEPLRRRGIGEKLLRHALQKCARRNTSRVFLEVRESNKGAKALYHKLGFKVIGRRKDYYKDEDALVMILDFSEDLPGE